MEVKQLLENVRILVIDDEKDIRGTLKDILEGAGYIVDTAKSGAEALEKANNYFYNLALVDIKLPDLDGTTLLTKMKETTPKMVKIIVTGYPDMQNAIEAINKGADGYLVKPFSPDELLKIVKEHLEKQQEEKKYSLRKVEEFIETRAREINAEL